MTFTGSVDAFGMLAAVDVTPTSVTVPAGGEVRFVNSSGVALTLWIDGRSVPLPIGGARSVSFEGGATTRHVPASATAFDMPVLGSLTSGTGTVTVGAAPSPGPTASNAEAPQSAQPLATGGPGATAPPAGASAGPSSPGPSAREPSPPGPTRAGAPRRPAGVRREPSSEPAARTGDRPVAGMEPTQADPEGDDRPAPLDGRPTQAAVADSTVTTVGDGRGISMLILVATVLLGGVGTAAIRSVVSVRGARVAR
jgi:hypothetical protein